ncbi:MAG: A24 family peptidase [Lachnospiraceae bacterium]|nr:A24 family peptidase [Lachnospiraceae bacterium]
MDIKYWIVYGIAVVLVCLCGYTDWTLQKIYNKWTLPSIGIGLFVHLLLWGIDGLLDSALGLLLGSLLFFLFVIRTLKAGDVKLFMALGAILGFRMNLQIIVGSILLGGVVGVILMLARKNGRQRFLRLWLYLKSLFFLRRWERYDEGGEGAHFCFGVCIAIATVVVIGIEIFDIRI